jgi:Mrp family chromosome partitioning ATPase
MPSSLFSQPQINQLTQLAELKRVAASVENAMLGARGKQLVITSPYSSEGKTMLSAGLAVQAATSYNLKVLAVDLHWHSPGLHGCFSKEQNFDDSGLKNAEHVFNYVQKTEIPGLDLLAAPKETRADRSSKGLKLCLEILDKAESSYDRVVLDTGPIFPPNRFMLDPMNFARNAGGTIMVILGGVTPRDMARRATFMFEYVGARLIGVVMNQWKNPIQS